MPDVLSNSKEYWEQRFQDDWERNHGREQSRFFSGIAIRAMPQWLISGIQENGWSLCDWGCAEGDGTHELARAFSGNHVTGVDFSQTAISRARARYGEAYIDEDWLGEGHEGEGGCAVRTWDVVFSSNTLEHFVDPWGVLDRLCRRAAACVVLLVPFKEVDRHPEHEFTFKAENIPFSPHPEFVLCFTEVIDASLEQPSYWGGDQVLLVYCRLSWAAALGLSAQHAAVCLSEEVAESDGLGPHQEAGRRGNRLVAQLKEKIIELTAEVDRRHSAGELLAEEVRLQCAHNEDLAKEVRRQHADNEHLAQDVRHQHARNEELAEEVQRQHARNEELATVARRESENAQRLAEKILGLERELLAIRRNPLRLIWRARP